jgi:MFS family permease
MTIFTGSLISLLGSALQGGSTSMVMLIAGRFSGGMAIGMLTSTIPMHASELSMPKWRGALSGLLEWFLS